MRLRVQSLASLSGLRIQRFCELWCRSAATALIRPLAWEPPYAEGAALEKTKKKNVSLKTIREFGSFEHELPILLVWHLQ